MTTRPLEKLIIVDYSGTLSLTAPRFGRPENLRLALEESGLASLGVSTPEIFWDRIANPTWSKGSTTPVGYVRIMAERIAALRLSPAPPGVIEAAASRFVKSYLDASRIDPRWQSTLTRLNESPSVWTVIATDHYAEIMENILRDLTGWGISAGRIGRDARPPCPETFQFFVANSAWIGVWKADRRFWETVRAWLPAVPFQRLLLVDDFGANEEPGDSYSEDSKVLARREKTMANLRETFHVAPETAPFTLPSEAWECPEAVGALIAAATARIEEFLEEPV
jgi:hypothetical protein